MQPKQSNEPRGEPPRGFSSGVRPPELEPVRNLINDIPEPSPAAWLLGKGIVWDHRDNYGAVPNEAELIASIAYCLKI